MVWPPRPAARQRRAEGRGRERIFLRAAAKVLRPPPLIHGAAPPCASVLWRRAQLGAARGRGPRRRW
eukprot:1930508-Lingulodinium_polyedra.AAC.1